MFTSLTKTGRAVGSSKIRSAAVVGVAALSLGMAALTAAPASAAVVDTDPILLNAANVDFGGNAFAGGTPVNNARVRWDINAAGGVAPWVNGTMYLSNMACGRIRVQYFDAAHVQLGQAQSPTQCAPAAGVWTFPVALTAFRDPNATHVHVSTVQIVGGAPAVVGVAIQDLF